MDIAGGILMYLEQDFEGGMSSGTIMEKNSSDSR
jgi:hypothetical protein